MSEMKTQPISGPGQSTAEGHQQADGDQERQQHLAQPQQHQDHLQSTAEKNQSSACCYLRFKKRKIIKLIMKPTRKD